MGVYFQDSNLLTSGLNKKIVILPISLALFVMVLAMGAGKAWSLDRYNPAGVIEDVETAKNISNNSSPTIDDGCLPLLKSIRHTSASSAMDRNQRTAGKAAALGLVFGFRFALEPSSKISKSPKPRLDVWQHQNSIAGGRYALAVADYRKCQKEKALNSSIQALQGFRWAR